MPDPENLYWYNDSEHITLFDHPRYNLVLACAADKMTTLEDHIELDYAHNLTDLTRREQEIPYFYKWWDELRLTRRFLNFRILLYYNIFTNQSYLTERI